MTVRKSSDSKIDRVRSALYALKQARDEQKKWKSKEVEASESALTGILEVSTAEYGVKFDYEGEEIAGFYQQNDPSVFWDQEKVIAYLQAKKLWQQCSIRTLDTARFEDMIQRGLIPAKDVEKFKQTGTPPKPFVRFGKPKKETP